MINTTDPTTALLDRITRITPILLGLSISPVGRRSVDMRGRD